MNYTRIYHMDHIPNESVWKYLIIHFYDKHDFIQPEE